MINKYIQTFVNNVPKSHTTELHQMAAYVCAHAIIL